MAVSVWTPARPHPNTFHSAYRSSHLNTHVFACSVFHSSTIAMSCQTHGKCRQYFHKFCDTKPDVTVIPCGFVVENMLHFLAAFGAPLTIYLPPRASSKGSVFYMWCGKCTTLWCEWVLNQTKYLYVHIYICSSSM